MGCWMRLVYPPHNKLDELNHICIDAPDSVVLE